MELAQQFNTARARILAGEQLTIDEQRQLITALRGARFGAGETSAAAKKTTATKKAAKVGLSDADLDAQLGDLGL